MDKRNERKLKFIKTFFPKKFTRLNSTKNKFVAELIRKKFLEGDHLYVLMPDSVIEVNQTVDRPPDMLLPSRVVEHFIRKASFRFAMDFCICRDSVPCRDYPREIGCLFLGAAARDISTDWGREVSEDEAMEIVRRAREAGLVHSVGKGKLDTVWLGVGPGEKLFTICNCCPCCCIARGLPYGHPILGENYNRMPGLKIDVTDDCAGCGTCLEEKVCIFRGISMRDGHAVINEDCRGCGRCVTACPNQAIKVVIQDDRYVQQVIANLEERLDVT